MIEPANPPNEARRLRALLALRILDTPPEERFDRITRMAAQLFDVPMSAISMIDANRQWFKSRHGLGVSETSRSASFCGHAILEPGVFHVADASQDERFVDNPLVTGDPNIRFYAGVPLHASGGEAVGTLCLLDTQPREFSDTDRALLDELARWAQDALAVTARAADPYEKLRPWLGVLVAVLVVGQFELLSSHLYYLPSPPAALVIAVVFAAYYSGLAAGLVSALIACVYFAHFFSIPGQPFDYTSDNLTRVLSWAVATPAIVVMTGLLRRRSERLFEAKMGDTLTAARLADVTATNAELRKSHEQLRLVTENAPMFVAFYDDATRCRYANPSYARWLGLDLQQMLDKQARDILAGQVSQSDFESVHSRVFAGERVDRQREHRHADGRVSHLAVSLVPQIADSGHVSGYYTFISDITELKTATLENRRARERLALALEGSNLCMWDWNLEDNTVYLDSAWSRMLGAEDPHETVITGLALFDLVHPDDKELIYAHWLSVFKGEAEFYTVEHRVMTRSGEWLWIASLGKVVERTADNKTFRMSGTNANITERKRAEARIEILATTDPLTLLPNRRVLADRLAHAMLTAGRNDNLPFALLFIDLDRFKNVNDSLGHGVGDQLLKQVAQRINEATRKSDTIARLGGDEFAVVLERLQKVEEAGQVAQKIINALAAPYAVDGHTLNITCSIGISVFPSDASDAETLLRNADLAMYSAKEHGRYTYQYFSGEMNERAVEKLALEQAMNGALQDGQFRLCYQPKFSMQSGQLVGVEALLRWQHPKHGLISPARFIPIAEETKLILPLGNWVIREACAQVMAWARRGHALLPVAVNLSVIQINGDLVNTVMEALRACGLEPHQLEIEITESVFLSNVDGNIEILRQLSDLGVRITIDDFGTGYSSLSYLRYFKLHTIKIDQSFVCNMMAKENDASIVRAIIALAHSMKMNVVAEGVESVEQKDALREMGCDEWQGYLNSRPLAADQFEQRFFPGTTQA